MTNQYDTNKNGALNYELAIDALREIGVRSGKMAPRTPREQIQQEQGPVCNSDLDALRGYSSESRAA